MKEKTTLAVVVMASLILTSTVFAVERNVPSEYPTIQAAIDAAVDGDAVLVSSGVYSENILWVVKTLTLKGVGDSPVLEATNPNEVAIFLWDVDSNSLIKNFIIRNSYSGISPNRSPVTLSNLTIVGNQLGISGYGANISNCIFWGNTSNRYLFGCRTQYSCIEEDMLNGGDHWIQEDSTFDYQTDYVGGGYFIYSYNYQERIREAIEDETTLQDMQNLINNDEGNPGVTASILYREGKHHLMLSGGQDYKLSINPSNMEVWGGDISFTTGGNSAVLRTKIIDLDQFSGPLVGGESITISGRDHLGVVIAPDLDLFILPDTRVGNLINAINEHFDSVAMARLVNGQIRLVDALCGVSNMEIALSYNPNVGVSTLALPTMFNITEGGSTDASIATLAPSTFIRFEGYGGGEGNIDVDPCFVDFRNGDYHLSSERGRYWPEHDVWVLDDVTSPCIDAGSLAVNPVNEPNPNGGRVNMGAYGQTPYASMSDRAIAGDINRDGGIDMLDFAIMANNWMDLSLWPKLGYQNVLDGIALLQTMIQGLEEMNLYLVRMQELANQSATGSYSSAQRIIMNAEFQELLNEIDSIAENTEYNGIKMLNDSSGSVTINTGSESLEFAKVDVTTVGLGLDSGLDISTVSGAQVALDAVSEAMNLLITATETFDAYLNSLLN